MSRLAQNRDELEIRSQRFLYKLILQVRETSDYQLTQLLLKLIFKNYSQSKTMLKSLKSIQILSNESEMRVVQIL